MTFHKTILSLPALIFFFAALSAQHCQAEIPKSELSCDYYVSTTGDDANVGTKDEPWRTIQRGVRSLNPGDVLCVRGGVYNETVDITNSGTADAPIEIINYPDETPIIDGDNYRLPTSAWGRLLSVRGSYVHISGFEVCYSNWMGVVVTGHYGTIDHFNSHHNKENGILVSGNHCVVEDSTVWQNCYSNVNGSNTRGNWASGLSAARHPNNAVLRRNAVYMNWGEGLSTYEANGTVINGNIVYDNFTNIYVSDATNVNVAGNLVYRSINSQMNDQKSSGSYVGIMMGDERYRPPSGNITIVNNFIYGNRQNIYWWQGTQGGGMVDVLIANNTLANAYDGPGILINSGPHQTVRILNNIVVQDNDLPVITLHSLTGISLGHNLWSKPAPEYARASGDIVGDPLLSRINFGSAEWFKLQPASPAVGRAAKLAEVTIDFFNAPRDAAPDIGGHELTDKAASLKANKKKY